MNAVVSTIVADDQSGGFINRQRRTPEQRLAAGLLQVERARKLLKRQEKAREAIRIRLAGEHLLRMAGSDLSARALVDDLKRQLNSDAHRDAFGLKPLR